MSTAGEGAAGVRIVAADLARVPEALRGETRKALRVVGEQVRQDARSRSSWSSRIPASLQMTVQFTGARTGVTISAAARRAPHARVYEGIVSDPFRHPLFGDRDFWYPQAARPFLMPAAAAAHDDVVVGVTAAIDTVLARHGF